MNMLSPIRGEDAAKTAPAPYELALKVTAASVAVDVPLLLQSIETWSPIIDALEGRLAPANSEALDFDNDDGLRLVEIAPGRFILSERDKLIETMGLVSAILDHTIARGDKHFGAYRV